MSVVEPIPYKLRILDAGNVNRSSIASFLGVQPSFINTTMSAVNPGHIPAITDVEQSQMRQLRFSFAEGHAGLVNQATDAVEHFVSGFVSSLVFADTCVKEPNESEATCRVLLMPHSHDSASRKKFLTAQLMYLFVSAVPLVNYNRTPIELVDPDGHAVVSGPISSITIGLADGGLAVVNASGEPLLIQIDITFIPRSKHN